MKYIIPLDAVPNQIFNIDLNGQQCTFEFISRDAYMYMNLTLNNNKVIDGMICLNKVDLVQYKGSKFIGRLYFEDTQGSLDPLYYGLNDRWLLVYEDD